MQLEWCALLKQKTKLPKCVNTNNFRTLNYFNGNEWTETVNGECTSGRRSERRDKTVELRRARERVAVSSNTLTMPSARIAACELVKALKIKIAAESFHCIGEKLCATESEGDGEGERNALNRTFGSSETFISLAPK